MCVRVCLYVEQAVCARVTLCDVDGEMIWALGAAAKAASLFPLPAWPELQGAKMLTFHCTTTPWLFLYESKSVFKAKISSSCYNLGLWLQYIRYIFLKLTFVIHFEPVKFPILYEKYIKLALHWGDR